MLKILHISKVRKKRVIFLIIVLVLIIVPFFMIPGHALMNNNTRRSPKRSEDHPGQYKFLESLDSRGRTKISNYGTHDWVADAALEVVANSYEVIIDPRKINWIRDVSINYAYLDEQGYVGSYNKYFVVSNEQYWKQ